MKNIVLWITMFSIINVFGQNETPEDLNFMLDDYKKAIWQKVFEVESSEENLVKVLQS